MAASTKTQTHITGKRFAIGALHAFALAIIGMGAVFAVLSYTNNVFFQVLSYQIHGAVIGLLIMYLGFRYFFSVQKLKSKVMQEDSSFSLHNFCCWKRKMK